MPGCNRQSAAQGHFRTVLFCVFRDNVKNYNLAYTNVFFLLLLCFVTQTLTYWLILMFSQYIHCSQTPEQPVCRTLDIRGQRLVGIKLTKIIFVQKYPRWFNTSARLPSLCHKLSRLNRLLGWFGGNHRYFCPIHQLTSSRCMMPGAGWQLN